MIAKMIATQKFDRDESRSSSKPINSEEVCGKVDRDEVATMVARPLKFGRKDDHKLEV